MADSLPVGAFVKVRLEGKSGTHKVRIRGVSDDAVSFVHEWDAKEGRVQGRKLYTKALANVELVEVLEPAAESPKAEEPAKVEEPKRPRSRRQKEAAAV
jgi:hypothetical protein